MNIARPTPTLGDVISRLSDRALNTLLVELLSNVVPSNGPSRQLCRRINRLIDDGRMCLDPEKYRHVYLPTLSRAVLREGATRLVHTQEVVPECDQLTLDLFLPSTEEAMNNASIA